MAVRKVKKSWWVDFSFEEKRYRKRSPQNSRAAAAAYEIVLRQRLARGEPIGGRSEIEAPTFESFAPKWLEEYVRSNNKLSEQRNRAYILQRVLLPFFGKRPITQITTRVIEQYKAQKLKEGLKSKTIRNHLTVLNRCITTGYEWLELKGSPPKIKWPKVGPVEMDFLSFGECEALLASAAGIDYEMILTAVRTGLRQGELKGLQWPSIDWENRTLTVRHSLDDKAKVLVSPKSNRIRHIPLDVDVYALLFRRKQNVGYVFSDAANGEPFTHKLVTTRLRRVCRKAGLRRIGWHTLRHTFASHLVTKGVPITVVKELMGHSSVSTTMRYAHLASSTLRTAIDMLSPKQALNADFGQPGVNQWLRRQESEILRERVLPKAA